MTESKDMVFDLCVIGCGPAGFAAAMRAIDVGKHVCIIEGGEIGGTGVKWGALASKTMWELAKDFHIAGKVDRGYRCSSLRVNFHKVYETVMEAVKERQYQMRSQIETFSPRLWNGPGSLTYKTGWGRFVDDQTIAIDYEDGREEQIKTRFTLIASGSRPRTLPNIEVDQKRIITSDGILGLKTFPRRMAIIGAGVTGCEYATIFANFGQTKVYLVDHMDTVIPWEDEDVSRFVSNSLKQRGVEIFQRAKVRAIEQKDDHLEVILDFADGHSKVVEVDVALVSVGRKANIEKLDLHQVGIVPTASGVLETGNCCQVKSNIYAAGDITPHPAMVNIAELEGRYAVKHMFGCVRWPLRYENLPTVMFFSPAVTAVGLNEKRCRALKIPFRVGYCSNALLPRAIAMRDSCGFVKIIVQDDSSGKILGMRAAGPQVSSMVMSLTHIMDQGKGIEDVLKSVYPHPTISEGTQECLRLLLGKSMFKPEAFPDLMQIRSWRPDSEAAEG